MAKKLKKIAPSEGMTFGLLLLGQVTGILVGSALLGWGFDLVANTSPLGLAAGVAIGSLAATLNVILKARKELE